jgi:trigger factor
MKVGEDKDVDGAFPDQHPNAQIRGKKVTFHIKLVELKKRVLPEVDDEFANDCEHDDLAAMKKAISDKLEARLKQEADEDLARQLVAQLCEKNPVPVPPSLVERQMRLTEQEILSRARSQGQKVTGLGDELRGKLVEDSEIKVRAGLLMAEIAKKEGIQIGNEEIENGLKELAEQTGQNLAKLRVQYKDQRKREMLIGMILENKVLDIIEAKAKIEEG